MPRALVSVSDKTSLVPFVKNLVEHGFEIISTGGTQKVLEEAGIETLAVEEVTGFPEMLDGRVKTLHPIIHGGLLARRDLPEHMKTLAAHDITPIDLVCVNLYPFKATIEKPAVKFEDAIENIDIGGPSMIRSAAKNSDAVTVVVDPADYKKVMQAFDENDETSLTLRRQLQAKAFRHTAAYDAIIADYLSKQAQDEETETLTRTYDFRAEMRYGENSHQKASFYVDAIEKPYAISSAKILHGKALSYNNIKDADAALRIIAEYSEPTVVALKHMNPCGIGWADTIETAWDRAYEADSISIFGGIIVLNRPVDLATAEKMHHLFLELIIAPSFEPDALAILEKKKNLRLMTLDFSHANEKAKPETVSVMGGLLVQEQDQLVEDPAKWEIVTQAKPSEHQLNTMAKAMKAVKHVKSNAILVANDIRTLGVGAGQMNRIDSTKLAVNQAKGAIDETAVMASDAFFPMDDCVQYAAEHGIKVIVQPGGSIKDEASVEMANKHGIIMAMTGIRHFRH